MKPLIEGEAYLIMVKSIRFKRRIGIFTGTYTERNRIQHPNFTILAATSHYLKIGDIIDYPPTSVKKHIPKDMLFIEKLKLERYNDKTRI